MPFLQEALPDPFAFRLLLFVPIVSSGYHYDSTYHVYGGNKATLFVHLLDYAWKIFL